MENDCNKSKISWSSREHWNPSNQWASQSQLQQAFNCQDVDNTVNPVPLFTSTNNLMPPPFLLPPWHKISQRYNPQWNVDQTNNFNHQVQSHSIRGNSINPNCRKVNKSNVESSHLKTNGTEREKKKKNKKPKKNFNNVNSTDNSNVTCKKYINQSTKIEKPNNNSLISKRAQWNKNDALSALKLEKSYNQFRNKLFIKITFPDITLDTKTVMAFHPNIKSVTIPNQYSKPRQVLIKIKAGVNLDEVITNLNKKSLDEFGGESLKAERIADFNIEDILPEQIDPYTIYIGNLPLTFDASFLKQEFPKSTRRDLGYSKKLKSTRYAFLRFSCISDAFEAFKKAALINSSDAAVIVRFKRVVKKDSLSSIDSVDSGSGKSDVSLDIKEELLSIDNDLDYGFTHDFWKTKSITKYSENSTLCDSSEGQDTVSTMDEEEEDEEEYDESELHPKPKLSEALRRFINSPANEDDYDVEADLPVIPTDFSNEAESIGTSYFDSPY